MGLQTRNIGRIPIYFGDYDPERTYKEKHRVTLYGSEFQAAKDNPSKAPLTYNPSTHQITEWNVANGEHASSTGEWYIMSNGTDAWLSSHIIDEELALGAVYDVSAKNPTAGPNNDGKWESLSALLQDNNLSNLIPTSVRKGGMSIKFICSSDNNKYVQFRYISSSTAVADFTNVANWQGVDDEPTAGSENLVESGGVKKYVDGTDYFDDAVPGSIDNNGAFSSVGHQLFVRTDYIPVSDGDIINVTLKNTATGFGSVYAYDANKDPLGWILATGEHVNESITIGEFNDSAVAYIAAFAHNTYNSSLYNVTQDKAKWLKNYERIIALEKDLDNDIRDALNIYQVVFTKPISAVVDIENQQVTLTTPQMISMAGAKRCYKTFSAVTTTLALPSVYSAVYIDYDATNNRFVGDLYVDTWGIRGIAEKAKGIIQIPIIVFYLNLSDNTYKILFDISDSPSESIKEVKEDIDGLNDKVGDLTNAVDKIYDKNYFEGIAGYINQDGSFHNGSPYFVRTDYIPVSEGDSFYVTLNNSVSSFHPLWGYDENKENPTILLTTGAYTNEKVVIPSGVAYIAACSLESFNPAIHNTDSLEYRISMLEPKVEGLQEDIESLEADVASVADKSTTILYNDHVNATDWGDTSICQFDNDVATIASVGEIYLKREYAIGRRVAKFYLSNFASSVFYMGCKALESSSWNVKSYKFDCVNGTLTYVTSDGVATTTPFNEVTLNDNDVYCVELYRLDDYDVATSEKSDTIKCKVYNTRTLDVVIEYTKSAWGMFKDGYTIGIETGGVSPAIHKLMILSLVAKPYLYIGGDSLTEGAQTTVRYGDLVGKHLNKPYIISGRSGGSTKGLVANANFMGRVESEIKYLRPSYVMIGIGSNNGYTEEKLAGLLQDLRKICQDVLSYGCKIILNNEACRNQAGVEVIGGVNDVIAQVRAEFGLNGALLNVATSLNNDGVHINPDLYNYSSSDMCHPTAAGNMAMYQRIVEDVPELFSNAMDSGSKIKNLPENYLSKESAENMLNAMVSVGVIASYTMTWDANNNRYAFTFLTI